MSDEIISCASCGRTFIWSYGEQRFYKERGLTAPRRCEECRAQRRSEQVRAAPDHSRVSVHRGPADGDQRWNEALNRASGMPPSPVRPAPRAELRRPGSAWWGQAFSRYAVIFFGLGLAGALLIAYGSKISWLAAWFVAMSLVAFLAYSYDKLAASSGWGRVPEVLLLLLALVGGTVGALLAMQLLRHKTQKPSFQKSFALIALVQLIGVSIYFFVIR